MTSVGHYSVANNTPDLLIKNSSLPEIAENSLPSENNMKFGTQDVEATPPSSPAISKIKNDNIIRSFFVKNEPNFHKASEPNWFYYWSRTQPIVDLKESFGSVIVYDPEDRCIQKDFDLDIKIVYAPEYSYDPPKVSNVSLAEMNTNITGAVSSQDLTQEGTYGALSSRVSKSNASAHPSCDGIPEVFGKQIITAYDPLIIKIGPGTGMKKIKFKNSSCVFQKSFYTTSTPPEIKLDKPCEDLEDGKITFRFTRMSEQVPSCTFDGNSVSLDPTLDNYTLTFGGLTVPNNYSYRLVSGDCVIEDGIRFNETGIETKVTGHNIEDRTCQYDVFCQEELLEGRTWTSEMGNRIPFRNKGDKCETMFTCNTKDVESEKVNMKTVSVGVYNRLLSDARASGINFPADVNDNRWYSTGSMHGCDRVRYCPADMQIRFRYESSFADKGRSITQDPNTGCYTQNCPVFNSAGCPTDESIPGGAVGPWQPPIDQGPCTEVKITLKQLVLWHDQLILNRTDYDADPDGNNLFRLAESILTDLGHLARYLPPAGETIQDPLVCTYVNFCRETLEVLTFGD